MAARTERRGPRRAAIAALIAAIAVVGTVAGFAITSAGYQAQEVPRLESSVWVTRDDGKYARVNTDLAELDTVRTVDDPSGVAQSGADAVVFSGGFRERWSVDAAAPTDLVDAQAAAEPVDGESQAAAAVADPTPEGTREVVVAGRHLVYRSDAGRVAVGSLDSPDVSPVDPFAAEAREAGGEASVVYSANAVGIDDDGRLAAYSAAEGAVRRFDVDALEFVGGPVELVDAPGADAVLQLAMAGGRWILVEAAEGRAWIEGLDEPIELDIAGDARLQQGSADGESALIADSDGLVEVDLSTGAATRTVQAAGVPAAPVRLGDEAVAAWISERGGLLWSASLGEVPLTVPDDALDSVSAIVPELRSNGDRVVLNEATSGLVWTAPDGRAVPLGQWEADDDTKQEGSLVVDDVAEQKPPVAVPDAFGVRAGQLVRLPVLLNDHDPNRSDVLTIDRGSLTQPDGFGTVSLVANSQTLVVDVQATSGTATFQYAVSDGQAVSAPVAVTLTVVPDDQNSAPEWCGVEECRQVWPSPHVLAGGTAIVPVLEAWVDPDGDPVVLTDARAVDADAPVTVVPRADGRVAIRHTDPNADASVPITLTVTDAHGAATEKTLELVVSAASPLEADAVAVTAGAGETVVVKVADHVSGGSGSFRLLDAVDAKAGASGLIVTPNPAAGEIELGAPEPGEHVVTYTVVDSVSQAEQSATIRLTVVDLDAPLGIAPITAFVRPGEDTTVDVLRAVQNSSGRVLLVSGASSSTGDLSVGIVGASQLRVAIAGGTAPAGANALLGRARVTVTDGTGASVVGVVNVFLAADAGDEAPIALPDSVTVRAGELADIPVLANDVSPRGARLLVGHDVVGSGTEGELAFAAGDQLRYVAPDVPGTYRLAYSVALESDPARTDHAGVTVTVLPAGANRPPRPPVLSARVLSGQSVEIPVALTGIDPDGDRVALSGISQPPAGAGTASIGAEGDTIVYRAPAAGVAGGQLEFTYTVRDGAGAEQTSTVRVGVLDAELSDAAPVTFSDYVRTTRGSATPITVQPLGNDRDPALGSLELVEVVPNAPNGSSEYERLAALIDDATALDHGQVVLRAGDVAGTNSYLYTARSSTTSSTAQGLIVLGVGESAAVDHPVITDTVVTARNRTDFEGRGLDVVTGKVSWSNGDLQSLEVELWGAAASRYDVDGWRVSGKLPKNGDVVAFRVTSRDDDAVEAYGILRIPAFDDLPVQLRSDLDPVDVGEEKTAAFDVRDLLDLPAADQVQLGEGPFTVQRANSSCTAAGADRAQYQAGREAPWSDTCLIRVRLEGQQRWSSIAVPIEIEPKNPQAQLSAISRTVAPGATETVALYDAMTSWEGGRVGDRAALAYSVSYGGSAFLQHGSGDQVSFEARADAVPGTRETATVSVSAFGGLSATITLVVGVAPPDAPRGASFTTECTVSTGSCSIPVTGIGGEYDPFAGKQGAGLHLVSIGASGGGVRCDAASVSTAGDAVVATFPSGKAAYGGTCTVPYTVRDAQNRTGQGTLTIDVLGYPQAPQSISTVAYTGTSVTLEIPLGEAAKAHPPVTGVTIQRDGRAQDASCSAALSGVWRCTVDGLENGQRSRYTARAVNSVGESVETSAVESWAYRAPEIIDATSRPVYDNGTRTDRAIVELTVRSSADTQGLRVVELNRSLERQGDVSTYRLELTPGGQVLTIVPSSRFQPPITGSIDGSARSISVEAAGAPRFRSEIGAGAKSDTSIEVTGGEVDANGSSAAIETRYVAWRNGGQPQCSVTSSGGGLTVSGGSDAIVSDTPVISGVESYETYRVKACASNGFGLVESNTVSVNVVVTPPKPGGTTTYTVNTTPEQNGSQYYYRLKSAPEISVPNNYKQRQYKLSGGDWSDTFTLDPEWAPSEVQVRGCWILGICTESATATPATAPTTVIVTFADQCRAEPAADLVTISSAARGSATVTWVTAEDAKSAVYTVTFTGAYASLQPIERTVNLCPPEPEPEPDPDPPTTDPTDPDPPTTDPTDPGTGTGG
ncbi:Ig-like domain-containing protein [Agromyces larvae]|uniref:Ig-like domain-containing protein n=1 Tax=Agromyces larvae TaxID=2929802 RepID=A0ABY4BXJ9_9MICO|nr:Ig-like domain-containing protein [Agromyces larvae]UOE43958.1 Ig-like domain-containing protein [Agromyces larvae]